MHRFFVSEVPDGAGAVELRGQDAKHAVRVLRLAEGDTFAAVIEGQGQYLARIIEAEQWRVSAVLEGKIERRTEPNARVTLFQGLPKGDKMDSIVQRCTEIGVHAIVPVLTDRTVALPDEDRLAGRMTRWRRIASESAELAGRTHIPIIEEPVSLTRAMQRAPEYGLCVMPWEEEQSLGLKSIIEDRAATSQEQSRSVFLLIGPEGGFNTREAGEARARGILQATLGPRMMRTENAGAVALALILYELGDMG